MISVPANETVTTTSTSTNIVATVVVSTGYYEACAPNNIAEGFYENETIYELWPQPANAYNSILGTLQPYDCCALCQQTAGCTWFNWNEITCYPENPDDFDQYPPVCNPNITSTCSLLTLDGCGCYTADIFAMYNEGFKGFTIGNGPCGQWTFHTPT